MAWSCGRTNDCLLKQLLFGELLPTRPVRGLEVTMEDLVVLRDIQGLGFDTFSWFKDWSQWLNVCKSTTVEECWISTGFWSYCGF